MFFCVTLVLWCSIVIHKNLIFSVNEMTATVRDHVETVMAVLVDGEIDSVDTTIHGDRECMICLQTHYLSTFYIADLQLHQKYHPSLADQLALFTTAVHQVLGGRCILTMTMVQTCYSGSDTVCGNPSNIHMDISRIVREIEEEVDMSDTIIAIGTEGENVTVDSTYEDALATTVINKVEIMLTIFKV